MILSGIIKADGEEANTKQPPRRQDPPDSSGSPKLNVATLMEGTFQSPHLCSSLLAARTSLSLLLLVPDTSSILPSFAG